MDWSLLKKLGAPLTLTVRFLHRVMGIKSRVFSWEARTVCTACEAWRTLIRRVDNAGCRVSLPGQMFRYFPSCRAAFSHTCCRSLEGHIELLVVKLKRNGDANIRGLMVGVLNSVVIGIGSPARWWSPWWTFEKALGGFGLAQYRGLYA